MVEKRPVEAGLGRSTIDHRAQALHSWRGKRGHHYLAVLRARPGCSRRIVRQGSERDTGQDSYELARVERRGGGSRRVQQVSSRLTRLRRRALRAERAPSGPAEKILLMARKPREVEPSCEDDDF